MNYKAIKLVLYKYIRSKDFLIEYYSYISKGAFSKVDLLYSSSSIEAPKVDPTRYKLGLGR